MCVAKHVGRKIFEPLILKKVAIYKHCLLKDIQKVTSKDLKNTHKSLKDRGTCMYP